MNGQTDISIIGLNELMHKLNALPDAVNSALLAKSQALADALADTIRNDKLSGGILESRTGLLKDSINNTVEDAADGVNASVSAGENVPYAAIQEYGGQTKAHVIEATQGKALAFSWAGKQAFFRSVHHPGSDIPERSYLRSAFDEMQDDILDGLSDALADSIT